MLNLGAVALGDTVDFHFTTAAANGTPTTLSGTPAVSAYVDNGTTELTAGITLTADFDSRTGLNQVRAVLTSGNGYSDSSAISFVITAGTVDGVSVVGYVLARCTLGQGVIVKDLTTAAKASVNAEVVDTLGTDTITEQAAAAPPAAPTIKQMLSYLYMLMVRNKKVIDASSSPAVETVYADDGTTAVFKRNITDGSPGANETTFDETVSG